MKNSMQAKNLPLTGKATSCDGFSEEGGTVKAPLDFSTSHTEVQEASTSSLTVADMPSRF